ncbi:DUF2155 domain-containing protein [Hyphomonas johnsonii]|uniref:Cellulase-like protein n=1 Tax=Hyphomonas johnsonii MHS-2 TaxID=1280950 RepID=A0A059FU04_9PROT|nr:DUF2155 domain-containing protein [Hyphomonas johnsonii]KCZ94062.1 hypothetical protein HJO_01765 [Hyphomonas johnsonii MHS-2]
MIRFLIASTIGLSLLGAAHAATFVQKDRATLRALDKITGRSTDIEVKVGEPVVFGSLKVELKACYQTPPEEAPESAAFLKIDSTQPVAVETMDAAVAAEEVETVNEDNPELFSGWMYASSPGLSALEHPVYDIWVIRCTASAPVKLSDPVVPTDTEPEPE